MISNNNPEQDPASFRDPSGFIFSFSGKQYRLVSHVYQQDYDFLFSSGLYEKLVSHGYLVPHEETSIPLPENYNPYKILLPKQLYFISYPYEWCFSQLKDAALLSLKVQKLALEHGMTLKDASAYNIQFDNGHPLFIDTLSFTQYNGSPWGAYRQFCQHFLAPLTLMSKVHISLSQLFRSFIDGIPLDIASAALPLWTWVQPAFLHHIHLHSKSQKHFGGKQVTLHKTKISKKALFGMLDHLHSTIMRLRWQAEGTEWGDYYNDTNYTDEAEEAKKNILIKITEEVNPQNVWDLGANVGVFSRLASNKSIPTISFDIDPAAVEKNYKQVVKAGETNLLPLILDLTNPSPGIGWDNKERLPLIERGPVDMVYALALIHHLAIANNIPLEKTAAFFAKLCKYLLIEFVPKSDSQVQRLLSTRVDIFSEYSEVIFEKVYARHFTIVQKKPLMGSERTLYLMKNKLNS